MSKEIAAKVSAEAVAVNVDAGHRTRHINASYDHTYPHSSRTRSNGMLRRGVTRSRRLDLAAAEWLEDACRRRRLQDIADRAEL